MNHTPLRISCPDEITCLALDHSGTPTQASDGDIRLACFFANGAFTIYSIPEDDPSLTVLLSSIPAPPRRATHEVRQAVYRHPLIVTIATDAEISIWDARRLEQRPARPTHRFRSYSSFPPLSMSLSFMPSESWKLLLVHTTPVYPSHWLPAASEITIAEDAFSHLQVKTSRKTAPRTASSGWVSEQGWREMELEWSRKLGDVKLIETDGKFLVVTGGDNILQVCDSRFDEELGSSN